MRLILMGPPGAGKGTQAAAIRDRFAIPHVSTGEMLREAVATGSPLGIKVKSILAVGKLVPDEVVGDLVAERLGREDARGGFLLDGFPRTIPQAGILDRVLASRGKTLEAVVKISLGDDEVVRRITGRRVCASCERPFHVAFSPPRKEGVCDSCGGALRQREDDREDVVRKRLAVYHEQTAPLAKHYAGRGLLREVDGAGAVEVVRERIMEVLES